MFSDNYINLCAEKKEAITTAAENMGFSRTTGLKWANGSVPRRTTLKIIADYFGITVEELLADSKKEPVTIGGGLSAIKREAIEAISKCSDAEAQMFLDILFAVKKKNPADQGGAGE